MPITPANPNDSEQEVIDWQREQVIREREETADRLRKMWNETDMDPLLHALYEQQSIRAGAEARIRHLVAYAREFVRPRPYTLEALAPSLGSSASAVRGGYDHRDVEQVAAITGRRSIVPQTPADTAAAARLVDELAARASAEQVCDQMPGVAAALLEHGWTPYAPLRRTANPKFAKQYVRWESAGRTAP